jgi:hypothetical protein
MKAVPFFLADMFAALFAFAPVAQAAGASAPKLALSDFHPIVLADGALLLAVLENKSIGGSRRTSRV